MVNQTLPPATNAIAAFDDRPLFEKALVFGVRHGIISQSKLSAISEEAPKGIVQIARYFGSEYLRPELEAARARLVNLVSLHLEASSDGDVSKAAQILQDNSLLSRSKAGSDLLKALIVMPQNTHFGMNERGSFADRHIPQLARWSLASFTEYQTELANRQRVAHVVDTALWMAGQLGVSADELQDAEPDAEAVIRTALLVRAARRKTMPDWLGFEKLVVSLRKKELSSVAAALLEPMSVPGELSCTVEAVRDTVMADLPRLLDVRLPARKLFDQTPAFIGRYFWFEDALSEISEHDRARSAKWEKVIKGHGDDSTLLTLFLCVAAHSTPKTLLTEKAALGLIRRIRKSGLNSGLALAYIETQAPEQNQADYSRLWLDFLTEALSLLRGDGKLDEALALLRRECNIV